MPNNKIKILRVCTVPQSLGFLRGFIQPMQQQGWQVVAVSSPGPELDAFAQQEQVPVIAVPMQRHISPVQDLKSLFKMIRVIRHERPTMVHSMTPKAGLLTMMAAWLCRVPVRVHTFTGLVWPTATGLKRRILMLTDWLTCACATHIIPEGQGVRHDLLTHHITRKDIQVLGYGNVRGVDLHYWSREAPTAPTAPLLSPLKGGGASGGVAESEGNSAPSPQATPSPFRGSKEGAPGANATFVFLFVGRIVRDKGINELITAFTRLHQEHPEARLMLVGPSEDNLDPITPQARHEIDTNPAIHAVGSQKDVRPFYAQAQCLVFPSYREGFPNVVLEAGAMGLPSIVTDINGSREIIIEGKNGTIIPPRDAEALYQAMKHFLEHPLELQEMAKNARPLIATRFDQTYVRQCQLQFYKKVLKDFTDK